MSVCLSVFLCCAGLAPLWSAHFQGHAGHQSAVRGGAASESAGQWEAAAAGKREESHVTPSPVLLFTAQDWTLADDNRLHFHVLEAGHSTLSDEKRGFYLFIFICRSCVVFVAEVKLRCWIVFFFVWVYYDVINVLKLYSTSLTVSCFCQGIYFKILRFINLNWEFSFFRIIL